MKRLKYVCLNGLFLAFCLCWLFPVYVILANSFKSRSELYENILALPKKISFQYYAQALEKMNFLQAFGNSAAVTLVSILILVVLASMTAWMLVRTRLFLSRFLFNLLVATMLIPFQTVMMPLMQEMGWINHALHLPMVNTLSGLIFMNVGFGASMAVFLFHGFVKSIPVSLEEAATIDGASKFMVFWRIVFPMLKPVTVTVMILDVIWIWNDYLLPSLVLTSKGKRTIPLSTFSFFGQYTIQWNMAMAGLALTIIPVIIFYLLAQKHIIKGVAAGAVK